MARLPRFSPTQFTRGLTLPFRGLRLLFARTGVKRYAILPLILNVVLYAVALTVFFYLLWNWQLGQVEWSFWGPVGGWLASAVNWMNWMVKLVVGMVALAAAFFTFTAVGMTLASPLNDILSEKVELAYAGGGERLDIPFRFTVKAGLLSFGDSLRNLARQLAWTALVLPFLIVPLVGFVPLLLVGAYFSGFGFLDSAMARNFLRPQHKKLLAARNYWEILGLGLAMQALFAVPLLGMLLMPVGVTAGTMIYCEADWDALLAEAGLPRPPGFTPPQRVAPSASRASTSQS